MLRRGIIGLEVWRGWEWMGGEFMLVKTRLITVDPGSCTLFLYSIICCIGDIYMQQTRFDCSAR